MFRHPLTISRSRPIAAAVLAFALIVPTPAPAAMRLAPSGGPSETPVAFSVRAAGSQNDRTERVSEAIRLNSGEALQQRHGVSIDEAASTKVEVVFSLEDPEALRYTISFDITRDGVAKNLAATPCEGSAKDLVACVDARLPEVVEILRSPAATEDAAVPRPEPVADPTDPEPKQPAKPRTGLKVAGGVLVGAGVVAVTVSGILLATRRYGPSEPGDNGRRPERTDRAPGYYAGIALGAAAVVTGAALLIVGSRRGKSSQRAARSADITFDLRTQSLRF